MKGSRIIGVWAVVLGPALSASASFTVVSQDLGADHYSASAVDPSRPWLSVPSAFDGIIGWPVWSAGADAPQWIEVDLGQIHPLAKVALYLEQYPAGNTTQQVYFSNSPIGDDRTRARLIHTFSGYSSAGDLREYVLPSPLLARYVQIYCTEWQNHVALLEVQVFVPDPIPEVRVDGVVHDGEYDVICVDAVGSMNANGYWVSEIQADSSLTSITDLYRWGCTVKDGVFYAFIELANRHIETLDGGQLGSPCSFFGFFIDTDNNASTGYAHLDFPNDAGFDIDLEVGNDNGFLGQPGTINFWYGESNFGIYTPASNANVYYDGAVLEISCPVADILAQTGVSAEDGRFWRVAPHVAGTLIGSGAHDYEADVATPAMVETTGLLAGDANRDGRVTFEDFCILQNHYGQSVTGDGWSQGDFDGNGVVNFADFAILQNHYGQVGPSGPAADALGPESLAAVSCLPGGVVLMAGLLCPQSY